MQNRLSLFAVTGDGSIGNNCSRLSQLLLLLLGTVIYVVIPKNFN